MSRTTRHIDYDCRSTSPYVKCYRRLSELGFDSGLRFADDPRDRSTNGYDSKPRSYLYERYDKQSSWKRDYSCSKTRKCVKRSASKHRRKQPIEMSDD